jgi:hypothetical protein
MLVSLDNPLTTPVIPGCEWGRCSVIHDINRELVTLAVTLSDASAVPVLTLLVFRSRLLFSLRSDGPVVAS